MTRLELLFEPADGVMFLTSVCGENHGLSRHGVRIVVEAHDNDLAMKAVDGLIDGVTSIDLKKPLFGAQGDSLDDAP